MPHPVPTLDIHKSPLVVFYEVTQACDLVCQHCRACAQPARHPQELITEQAKGMISQLATFPTPPMLVLTGGDPFKRPDVAELVSHARLENLTVAMTPSATPLVTASALAELAAAGLSRLAVSLDGADAVTHDAFRGVPGSFQRTLDVLVDARAQGLSTQVNTTVGLHNIDQIDLIAELLGGLDIALWSVFFLVPVGRAADLGRLNGEQCEQVFEKLWHHARTQPYGIKTTEAPHYRRYVLQHGGRPGRSTFTGRPRRASKAPLGINDGKGVMFISHTGRIYPSGFLPIECGRYPQQSVVDIYQNAPLLRQLRDPDQLGGKCGRCEFRSVCGGSRARALAVTGDPLSQEPDCTYEPRVNGTVRLAG